jgi:hypothetical protein
MVIALQAVAARTAKAATARSIRVGMELSD